VQVRIRATPTNAAVAQWQSAAVPTLRRGIDTRRPLQLAQEADLVIALRRNRRGVGSKPTLGTNIGERTRVQARLASRPCRERYPGSPPRQCLVVQRQNDALLTRMSHVRIVPRQPLRHHRLADQDAALSRLRRGIVPRWWCHAHVPDAGYEPVTRKRRWKCVFESRRALQLFSPFVQRQDAAL
jgi:hypothetical protein